MPNLQTSFPGDHSRLAPPDPISNSEVKRTRADDSVGFPHVKVGHCQEFITIRYSKILLGTLLEDVIKTASIVTCWRSSVGRATDL